MEVVITVSKAIKIQSNAFVAIVLDILLDLARSVLPQIHRVSHLGKQSLPSRCKITEVFLPASCESEDISEYLNRGAYVQAFGRPVKVDDVSSNLARRANRSAS